MPVDTPPHDTTHSALLRETAPVTDAKNMRGAQRAIADMNDLRERLRAAQDRRDDFVGKLYVDDGMRPPEIARATGMSISNVRLICHLAVREQQAKK